MSISDGLFSALGSGLILLLFLVSLVVAARRAPWDVLIGNRSLQHLFFGAAVLLAILWTMRAGISPGLGIHFLGATLMTLMFGWDLAILASTLALLAMTVLGLESWGGFGINGFCSILIPVVVSHWVWRFVEYKLPPNFFVYLFLCGFFGAALAIAAGGMTIGLLLWLDGVYDWGKITHEYLRYLPLIMFPEALLNGMILTGLLVFYPDWVRTFDAHKYIDEQ